VALQGSIAMTLRRRYAVLAALLVVALISTGLLADRAQRWPWRLFGSSSPPDSAGLPVASSAPQIVSALGRLEPESRVVAIGASPGSRLERLEVDDGDRVEAGDVLGYLDSHGEMLAARDHAAALLAEARRRLEVETSYGAAAIDEAKAQLDEAERVLQLQIEEQKIHVRLAEAEETEAERDLERAAQLLSTRTLARSGYDDVALAARLAGERLQAARAALDRMTAERENKLWMGQVKVRLAEAGLSRQEVATQVDSLAVALKLAEARLERTIIKAPFTGEVLEILAREGESVGNQAILKLGSTASMFATAEVYETDVGRVAPGQRATVISRAFPERLTGTVERVGTLVSRNDVLDLDPTADADARVIEVRIRLDDSELAAGYSHHQVDVLIEVGEPAPVRGGNDRPAASDGP
jgi:HlyD family secretion protein